MVRYYVIFSCLFLGLTGMQAAHAVQNVRAEDGQLTLPVFNPLRYRVPATPQAQKLHKQILRVSHDLKILRAVPLDDPSIESRLKQIIQKKIILVQARLNVLKKDMTQRQALVKSSGKSSQTIPVKEKGGGKSLPLHNKKKLQSKDPAEEIKSLKKTLLEVSQKLAALERGMKPAIGLSEPKLQKMTTAISEQKSSEQDRFRGGIGIILPVAKQYVPTPPKQVRTSVIYPGNEQPNYSKYVTYSPRLPEWKPQVRLQDGVYLPFAKPVSYSGLKTNALAKKNVAIAQKKNTGKNYASVEDQVEASNQWAESDVVKAKVQCAKLFEKLNISFTAKLPIKKGHCGTPAPILFTGFGKQYQVKISPAATINCKSAAVIAKWMNDKVQPLAVKLLGAPISKIDNVASYNCRNRYGRKNGRISEHAYANALDVMGFTTQKGEKISVLKDFYSEDKKGEFLRKIHQLACKDKFGTVLGPEANAAHKNHFHLDLAKRRHSAYCE